MAEQVLKITVDDAGNFTYDHPNGFNYTFGDTVAFECNRGPFTITYQPFNRATGNSIGNPQYGPFGVESGVLKLTLRGDIVTPQGFRTAPQVVVDPNIPQGGCNIRPIDYACEWKTFKLFSAYRYDVAIDGGPSHSTKDGMWIC